MARSQESSTPPFIFSAGCLFILLVTAVQVWRVREEAGRSQHVAQLPVINFAAPAARYGAEIRAEYVLADVPHIDRAAVPAPPVAASMPLTGPVTSEPPLDLDSPPLPVLGASSGGQEPLAIGDVTLPPLFSELIAQPLPPPTPEIQNLRVGRPIVLGTPSHLANRQPIESAVAPPASLSEASAPQVEPEKKKPAPVVRRLTRKRAQKPPAVAMHKKPTAYAVPNALLKSGRELSDPGAMMWAKRLEAAAARLLELPTLNAIEAVPVLNELRQLEQQAAEIALAIPDRTEQSKVLSTAYAIDRRLATYAAMRRAMHPEIQKAIQKIQNEQDPERVSQAVANILKALGTGSAAEEWAEFLSLDDLAGLAESNRSEYGTDRMNMATQVLDRIATPNATREQQEILQAPLIQELQRELRTWATVSVDHERLLRDLENYEAHPSVPVGELLTRRISQMRWSFIPQHNHISQVLNSHYRNANLRVAMTEEFMNRMLPVVQDIRSPVREEILGARVFGNSATWTKTAVQLIPDPSRIHLQLQANGFVAMETRAFKGPVVAFNRNRSEFYLRKPVIVDSEGVNIGQSNAISKASTNLLGLKTQFDKFPLLGSIVRRAAVQKFMEQRNLTSRIIERRVANNAESQMDRQVTQQLAAAEGQLHEKFIVPLRRMNLNPETIHMETTTERIVFRGRLSGYHQLAAYTSRPRAIADNLVSFQLHESSANNVIQQLRLDGKQGDLRELLSKMLGSVKSLNLEVPDEVPEDVHIELASHDALRVYFDEGHVRFTVRIAELSTRRRAWHDFVVAANYSPYARGFQIELGREGVIELSGRRLNLRDQVALRGIFGKVFSKNRNMNIVHSKLASDERLNDLEFSQIVLRDGWLGVSVNDEIPRVARSPTDDSETRR